MGFMSDQGTGTAERDGNDEICKELSEVPMHNELASEAVQNQPHAAAAEETGSKKTVEINNSTSSSNCDQSSFALDALRDAFKRTAERRVHVSKSDRTSSDIAISHLTCKLRSFTDALRTLKECSAALIIKMDEEISRIKPGLEQMNLMKDSAVSIVEEEITSESKINSCCTPSPDIKSAAEIPNVDFFRLASCSQSMRNLCNRKLPVAAKSLGSRSISPSSMRNTRRKNGSKNVIVLDSEKSDKSEAPAPSGGFKRLADMKTNAFLDVRSVDAGSADVDVNSTSRLRPVIGQCTLVEHQNSQSFNKFKRRASVRPQVDHSLSNEQQAVIDVDLEKSSTDSCRQPSQHRMDNDPEDQWLSKVSGDLRTLAFGLEGFIWKEGVTIGPYLDFLRILIVGLIDFLLVFVMLFWPDKDFVCPGRSPTRTVVKGTDIIATIATILIFHTGDVISGVSKRDISGRRLGLQFFLSSGAGGRWKALFNISGVLVILLSAAVVYQNFILCIQYSADDSTSSSYRSVKRLFLMIQIVRCCIGMYVHNMFVLSMPNRIVDPEVVVHSQKCIRLGKRFRMRLRKAVSMSKRRFVDPDNRFDLDLTYICDRLIAMSIPCVGGAFYRNNIKEVARFFATRHYGMWTCCLFSLTFVTNLRNPGRFLLFNLCEDFEANGNGCYDCMLLYDQVQKLPFRIHNVPPLHILVGFCKQANAWLGQHRDNIVAIHCQGGKGRTGTFCCALMIWNGFVASVGEALKVFSDRRSDPRITGLKNNRPHGVARPCQLRYLRYVEDVFLRHLDFASPKMKLLESITIHTMPLFKRDYLYITFVIECFDTIQYDYGKRHGIAILEKQDEDEFAEFKFDLDTVVLKGDVTIRFFLFEESSLGPAPHSELGQCGATLKYGNVVGNELFFVSFHTNFHDGDITFAKADIDGAHNKSDSEYLSEFSITLSFSKDAVKGRQSVFQSSSKRLLCLAPEISSCDSVDRRNCLRKSPTFRQRSHGSRAAGLKLVQLYSAVEDMFSSMCPVLTFHSGEILYDPEDNRGNRNLYMICSGVAEYQSHNRDGHSHVPINRGDSMAGLSIGTGEFFGEMKFLLGSSGDPSLFCIRAQSDIVQVRVFKARDDRHGPISITGTATYLQRLQLIFELLAKSLSTKARSLAAHVSRLSIKLDNVKRDHRVATRDAQVLQTVVKEMQISPNIYHIKMATATLFSKKGTECVGHLLIFSDQIIFYSKPGYSLKRNRNLQLHFKSISNVSSFGDKLSIIVNLKHISGQQRTRSHSREIHRKSVFDFSSVGSSLTRIINSKSQKPKSRANPALMTENNAIQHLKKRFHEISGVATEAYAASPGEILLCIHLRLGDSEICNDIKNVLAACIAENAVSTMQHQKYSTKNNVPTSSHGGQSKGTELTFGYMLPNENLTPEEQDAINQIFDHGKLQSYKAGNEILRCGCTERNLYHILNGSATCVSMSGQKLVRLEQGEIFGEISFLDTGDMGAGSNVVADHDLECIVLSYETMDMLATSNPLAGIRFWRSLAFAAALRMRQQYHLISSKRITC